MTIYQTQQITGIRPMQYKVSKSGVINYRVVGTGKLFTWSRYGTLPAGTSVPEWIAAKGLVAA